MPACPRRGNEGHHKLRDEKPTIKLVSVSLSLCGSPTRTLPTAPWRSLKSVARDFSPQRKHPPRLRVSGRSFRGKGEPLPNRLSPFPPFPLETNVSQLQGSHRDARPAESPASPRAPLYRPRAAARSPSVRASATVLPLPAAGICASGQVSWMPPAPCPRRNSGPRRASPHPTPATPRGRFASFPPSSPFA